MPSFNEAPSIPALAFRALREEARALLRRVLAAAIRYLDGPPPPNPPIIADPGVFTPHENVAEAIAATAGYIASARSDTMDRRKWAYLDTEDAGEKVVDFYGQPKGTPFQTGLNSVGRRVVAVWMGTGGRGRAHTDPPFTPKDIDLDPDFG